MPQGGVSARAARRSAAPWWEELDSEAFREFPAARRQRITRPAPADDGPVSARAPNPVAAQRTAPVAAHAPNPVATNAPNGGGRGIEGRRTITIRGQGAERNLPMARPTLRRHERPGYRPDRTALWAVMLGMLLILVAAASAHAAVVSQLAH
ncbi:MAG TPA: hypothetical protein VME22_21335 [Solirubrobacteraceae bacterium]|nr:hypothetical protein [Solirubrobacteraceae bacterium]